MAISVFVFIKNHDFQKSRYAEFQQEISGYLYQITYSAHAYVGLKETNLSLLEKVHELEISNLSLQAQLKELTARQYLRLPLEDSIAASAFDFVVASVVNNSIAGSQNLITINKGALHGIQPDMGVFDSEGVVGTVIHTSDHFSVILPVLNSKFRVSGKIKRSNYFGSLAWDGTSSQYASLEELPRHVDFNIGDTVVTSQFSEIFPEGIPIGIIESAKKQKNDKFNTLQVKLMVDFASLTNVLVVINKQKEELDNVEEEARRYVK
jgi:rod shape-determining protein MreC